MCHGIRRKSKCNTQAVSPSSTFSSSSPSSSQPKALNLRSLALPPRTKVYITGSNVETVNVGDKLIGGAAPSCQAGAAVQGKSSQYEARSSDLYYDSSSRTIGSPYSAVPQQVFFPKPASPPRLVGGLVPRRPLTLLHHDDQGEDSFGLSLDARPFGEDGCDRKNEGLVLLEDHQDDKSNKGGITMIRSPSLFSTPTTPVIAPSESRAQLTELSQKIDRIDYSSLHAMQGATHHETIPAKSPALKSPRKTIASPSPSRSSPPPFYLTPPPPPPLPPPSWFEEHGQYLYEYARELLLVLDLQQGQDDERTLSFNNDGINHLNKHHQILHDTNDSNWHTIHEEIIRTFL